MKYLFNTQIVINIYTTILIINILIIFEKH